MSRILKRLSVKAQNENGFIRTLGIWRFGSSDIAAVDQHRPARHSLASLAAISDFRSELLR